VYAGGYARHEEEGRISAHFVMIGEHVGLPFLENTYTALTFIELCRQPVAVQVKPIVITSTPGPGLSVLAIGRISRQVFVFVGIDPGGESVETIGVEAGIKNDDDLIE